MERKKYKLVMNDLSAIKYEEKSEFESSVSADAYDKAFQITRKILNENRNFRELKSKGETGNRLRNSEQIYNILFFTGAKGSGKTSAMLSYMEYLKDFYRESDRSVNRLSSKEHLMFTGLEYIDASVMDKKEDILGCILSKMLKKWKDEERRSYESRRMGIVQTNDYAYRKRIISLAFDRVYTNLKNLRSTKDVIEDEEDTFLETMEKLSLSWNLKESFQALVQEYLEIMKYPNTEDLKTDNHFLVISIDEADMNIERGFEIIEQVRQYLMGPNIIVLLSADSDQLEKICDNHFLKEFSAISKSENMDKHIRRLTREYLEKIIPSDRRIFMPSGREWKFLDKEVVEVYYNNENGENKYGEGTIKQIIQKNCKDNLGIELHKNGELIKYFVPNTLREFSSWIKKMNEISNSDSELKMSKAYDWFWGEAFPLILKKEDEVDVIFSTLSDLAPQEQIEMMKNVLDHENNKRSLLELLASFQIKNITQRKKSNVCLLYFSMKIAEMINCNSANKAYLEYYSPWGIWGNWEKKMGYEYGIKIISEKPTMTCNIHCFEFSKWNSAFETNIDKFIVKIREKGKALDQEIDKLKNFQYIILFLEMNKDIDKNPWKIEGNSKIVCNYNNMGEYRGIFSFSNSILNIFKGSRMVELFCQCIENALKNAQFPNSEIKNTMGKLSIIRAQKEENQMLIPLFNLEFLVKLGKELEKEFAGKNPEEFTKEKVSMHLFMYFDIIKENLRKYDNEFSTNFEERFSKHELFKKIINKDHDFIDLFYENIQKIYVPKEIGLSD